MDKQDMNVVIVLDTLKWCFFVNPAIIMPATLNLYQNVGYVTP